MSFSDLKLADQKLSRTISVRTAWHFLTFTPRLAIIGSLDFLGLSSTKPPPFLGGADLVCSSFFILQTERPQGTHQAAVRTAALLLLQLATDRFLDQPDVPLAAGDNDPGTESPLAFLVPHA
jgi:hypothetical protein